MCVEGKKGDKWWSYLLALHTKEEQNNDPPAFFQKRLQHSMEATGKSLTSSKCNETQRLSPLTC